MRKDNTEALKRADELIRAMVEKELDHDLHGWIREWFMDAPNDGAVEEALALWAANNMKANTSMPDRFVKRSFRKLAARLGFSNAKGVRRVRLSNSFGHIALRVAAVLLPTVITMGTVFFMFDNGKNAPVEVTSTVMAVSDAGDNEKFFLPDGSAVTLGRNSELTYPDTFSSSRDVWLDGEAFFVVAHDEEHPFTVHHDEMKVRVLGTEFGVKAYSNLDEMHVVLDKGSVAISHGERCVELTPGKKARIDKTDYSIELAEAGRGEIMKVRRERFAVEDMPTLEVLHLAADYFGKTLIVAPGTPAGESISIITPEEASLEAVISYMNKISDSVRCRVEGETILVSRR